jgi:hypothetical protein
MRDVQVNVLTHFPVEWYVNNEVMQESRDALQELH